MSYPSLDELPAPPPGKTGWPWTEASEPLSASMAGGSAWPKISIVTPSYNQGQFIEETIRSVLLQGYPNLEYIVIDGGSTDESVEIIEKYTPWIDYWVSEEDRGQSHAINKGFEKATGVYGSWINSDDMLAPGALFKLGKKVSFKQCKKIYAGICNYINRRGQIIKRHQGQVHSFEDLIDVAGVWRAHPQGHIVQPETLFPIKLFEEVNGVDEKNPIAMDYDLWGRMLLHGAEIEYVDVEVCHFRVHAAQKTADRWKTTKSLIDTAIRLTEKHPAWSRQRKRRAINKLKEYRREKWHSTGRLARLGLPEPLVEAARSLQSRIT